MRNISKLDAGFGNITGAILAIASGGSLVGMIILLVTMLAATPTFAQDEPTDIQVELKEVESELAEELSEAAMEIQEALDEVGIETGIHINIDDDGDDRPKLGVYLSDMDFEDAYKMRYPYPHGTLVDGTVRSGNADKAGLIEDDIIMYFDGTKVLYEDHLVRLIRSKHYGDQVEIVYWRDEAMDTTQVTFAAPEKKEMTKKLEVIKKEEEKKKRKNSRGYGGGGFTPMLVQDEGGTFADVTELMNELGLASTPIRDEGIVLWGGSGQGFVGNGWFLGGFGNAGSVSSTITATHSNGTDQVERQINFRMGLGGLTVEKRFAPFSFAVIGGGVGLGMGGVDIKVTQDEGKFSWTNLNDELIDTKSTSVNLSKSYFIAHPRANLMIRLTSWMRLKAEYGYLYGYPFYDGWKATLGNGDLDTNKDNYFVTGSEGKFNELGTSTVSLGLWFGF